MKIVKKKCSKCGKEAIIANKNEGLEILTKYGRIPVYRDYLFCRCCHEGFAPLDRELYLYNDGEHKVTREMADLLTYSGQLAMSFEKASEIIEKFININVSESLIRDVTEETGKMVFEKDMQKAKESYEKPEIAAPRILEKDKKKGTIYILTDGSQVNTISKDEKGSTWHEMKLGLIFCDFDSIQRKDGKSIITKKEYVTYFGSVNEFKKILFDAACRNGYGKINNVVVIGDGAHWIWSMCEELFPDAVQILDYYHMVENVSKYSKYLYPDNEVKAKSWRKDITNKVKEGKIDDIISELANIKEEVLPAGIPNLKTYFTNNRYRIHYCEYEEKGYFIGSGAIESGNKLVIQQRMKQAGMRWSLSGGQYIASLRAKYASNLWDVVRDVIGL